MTKRMSHQPRPAGICDAFRGGAGLPQATQHTAKPPMRACERPATSIPIVSLQAFGATLLRLTLPPMATLNNRSRTLSP
ncbi:hypothetical protein KGO5_05243 [Sinorhizobium sp. KGO-5]|nr:hypothetical protein KGO5_05243 [Sinorhizobium sp. KGO-5]